MKVTASYTVKNYKNNIPAVKHNSAGNNISPNQIKQYNPVFYKPVNFTGENTDTGFGIYFPEDILHISEEEFDKILLKVIENPSKRNTLAEYITSFTAKDNQTMNFINMWKRQVPTLISQGLLTTMPANTSDFCRRIAILGSKNSANSSLQKFLNSDFQMDIIMKDGKSATAGIISWKLFSLANANPEPYSKTALYMAAITVGLIGYNERSKDVQKIQNRQYLQAVKEMMKIGVLDPYLLLNYVDKSKVNLSEEDQKAYEIWKEDRVKDLRYQKSGTTVDKHNDFDTPEARNVLLVLIQTLQNLGFDDEKIGAFLQYLAATYDSVGQSREAEYLTRMAGKTYLNIRRRDKWSETCETLGYLCEKNQKYSEAVEAFSDSQCCAKTDGLPDYNRKLNLELNIMNINQKRIENTRQLDYLLHEDYKISKSKERKDAFSELFNSGSYSYLVSEESNLQEDALTVAAAYARVVGISDDKLANLLKIISKYPLDSLDYKPTYSSDSPRVFSKVLGVAEKEYGPLDDYDTDKTQAVVDSTIPKLYSYITERVEELEEKVLLPKLSSLTTNFDKASIIVGANLINGTLKDYVQQIINKNDKDCSLLEAEVLKICADRLAAAKKDDYSLYYHARYGQEPEYLHLLQKRINIIAEHYGDYSEELYTEIAEFGEKGLSPQTLIYKIIPILKNAPKSVQEKYLPDMYARYGKMKYFELQTQPLHKFNDKQALDVIAAYVKYFDTAKKIDQTKVMEFLNFLDNIYTTAPEETCEVGFGYMHDLMVMDVPLFDSINTHNNKKEFDRCYEFTTWGLTTVNNALEAIVQKAPGIYRVNERKFLDMMKKHEIVWFQNRFNEKMDNKMIAIEKSVDNPKLL